MLTERPPVPPVDTSVAGLATGGGPARLAVALVAGLLGMAANAYPLSLFGPDAPPVLLGPALALLVAMRLGGRLGTLTQLVAVAPALVGLDAGAVAVLPMLAEPAGVVVLRRRVPSLALAAAVFWVVVGGPLDAVLLLGALGVPATTAVLYFVSHLYQGMLAALFASLFLMVAGRRLPSAGDPVPEGLRGFVLARVTAVALVPVLALAMVSTRTAYRNAADAVEARASTAAQALVTSAQEYLTEPVQALRRAVQEMGQAGPEGAVSEVLSALLRERPEFINASRVDAAGLIRVLRPDTAADGSSTASAEGRANVSRRSYFVDARRTRRTSYASVLSGSMGIRRPAPEPILVVAEPLSGPDGAFDGVVYAVIDLVAMDSTLFAGVPEAAPVVTLADQRGTVVVSSGATRPGSRWSPRARGALTAAGGGRTYQYDPGDEVDAPPGLSAKTYGVHVPMLAGGWTWDVTAEYRAAELHAAMGRTALRQLLILLGGLGLIYVVVNLVARQIAAPLLAAQSAARDIHRGAPDAERRLDGLRTGGVREFRALAAELAEMAVAVRHRQRHVEAQALESHARLEALFETAPVGIAYADRRGLVTESNEALAAMLRRPRTDLPGRSFLSLFDIEEHDELGVLRRLFAGELDHAVATGVLAVQDERIWVLVTTTAVRDDDGAVLYVLAIVQDVTDTRRLGERLLQAQRLESVGLLAAGVAHDFNNALTPIIGHAELAIGEPDEASRDESMREIITSASRARDLTGQLLALARKQVLRVQPVDLSHEVAAVARMVERVLRENIRLVLDFGGAHAMVRADRGQLHQVLMNLVINAQEAMPEGGTLSLATDRRVVGAAAARSMDIAPGAYVSVVVQDTGTGMDAATIEMAFEPFFTTKDAGRGSGLGLATSYGIVRQHGGVLTVESAPGDGARFTILLPVLEAAEARATTPDESRPSPGPERLPSGCRDVLLVEDEPAVRSLVSRVLRAEGYRVLEAATVGDGLAMGAAMPRLDLVVTDVILPDSDGRALVERLRDHHPDARVLFMSGYSGRVLAEEGRLVDDVQLLAKPFGGKELIEAVGDVLHGRPVTWRRSTDPEGSRT